MNVSIEPVYELKSLSLMTRGAVKNRRGRAVVSSIPISIAESEVQVLQSKLEWKNISAEEVLQPNGPGNIVMTELEFEHVSELCSSFGEKGIRAARVADKAVCAIRKYLLSEAPVGEYLADQLLLPMALAGDGEFLCTEISSHTRTNMEVIQKFLKVKFSVREQNKAFHISIT